MTDAEKVKTLLGLLDEIHDALVDREDGDEDGPNFAARITRDIDEVTRRIGHPNGVASFPRPQVSFPNGVDQ
jgi:hypothetical protein